MPKSHFDLAQQHLRWAIASLADAKCQALKAGDTETPKEIETALEAAEKAKATLLRKRG